MCFVQRILCCSVASRIHELDGRVDSEVSVKAVKQAEVSARRICVYPVLALNCEESLVTLPTANQTPV